MEKLIFIVIVYSGFKKLKAMMIKNTLRNSKNSSFIEEQNAREFLSNLELKTPPIKIPILGDILFQRYKHIMRRCIMNEKINKLLLSEDKFMP